MITLHIDREALCEFSYSTCSTLNSPLLSVVPVFYTASPLSYVRSRQLCRPHIHMHPFVPAVQMTSRGAQIGAGVPGKDIWRERNSFTASNLNVRVCEHVYSEMNCTLGRVLVVLRYWSDSDGRQYRHTPTGALVSGCSVALPLNAARCGVMCAGLIA
jgi:hypothetical protein